MESSATSLVLTKLRPPAARPHAVRRESLLARLGPHAGTDLVLICAPAGYGKTTLLVEWAQRLRQAGASIGWYSLDESDNNPPAFGAYLIAALKQALGPGSGLEAVEQLLRASAEIDLARLMPGIINAVLSSGRPVLLALDDYHLIHIPAIHYAVEFLIDHRPDNLCLAIGSRTHPPLPLARLRAKGRLIELRAPDLRFSNEETGEFLRGCMQLDVSGEVAHYLGEQVEGWAAGLQLAALSLAGSDNPQAAIASSSWGRRNLAEYLLEEVVNRLPEELQSFLLYTSILERLSAPACDAILGIIDSAGLLRQIEQANLFLTALDEAGEWFRYHPLFREFLQSWLTRTQPERAAMLHRAACEWFAEHGSLREAAFHAFLSGGGPSGDGSFAADFVERQCFPLIIQSDIATIYEWCAAFPEAMIRSRPRLCVFQALALAYRFQGQYGHRIDARLQQAKQALAGLNDPEQAFEVTEMAGVVQAFQAMTPNPTPEASALLDLAEARLAVFPEGDPGRFPWLLISGYAHLALSQAGQATAALKAARPLALGSGLYFGMVETTFHLARLAHSQGQLAEALNLCRAGQAEVEALLPEGGLSLPALGCLDVAAGSILLEQDRLDEAELRLRRGLERMGLGMNPYYLMTAYQALFRLNAIQGHWEQAQACLDQLDLLWPDIQFLTQGLRAEAQVRAHPGVVGAAQAAGDWLRSYRLLVDETLPLAGVGPIGAGEAYFQANLIWMRLQILLGEPEVVAPYLERQLPFMRESDLLGREIELRLIEAQLLHRQGRQEQALAVLEQVINLGYPRGYRRVFDQGAVLDDLIHLAGQRGLCPAAIPAILAAIRTTRSREAGGEASPLSAMETPRASQSEALIEALSPRELDVLCLLAEGASNQAIAKRLVIAPGTVKIHINHIFDKLGVSNRTEAAAKARRMGLLR